MLYGANGAGKTNLLEAVSLFSPGRGLRRAALADLRRKSETDSPPNWGIAASLSGAESEDTGPKIGTGQIPNAPSRRQIRIDGKGASGPDLAKLVSINWLTPAQDRLFTGPASERRKFLDRMCLAYAPAHGRTMLAFEKSRSERNRLLSERIDDAYWFDALEADMAERGAQIARARFIAVQALSAQITARPENAFPKAALSLDGEAEALYLAGAEEGEVCEFIAQALRTDRHIDQRAGRTLRGIHKTDLAVTHIPKSMPASDCSTGEQKALLIGLVLAHARSQMQMEDTAPRAALLLLDEVAAHLDEIRRAALAEDLIELGAQVFLTGTDENLFSAFAGRAQVFKVEDNMLHIQT